MNLYTRKDFYSSRSGIEGAWSCPRKGYLSQFHLGMGMTKVPRPYWLDVGSAVHLGLAYSLNNQPKEGVKAAIEYFETSGQREWMKEYNFVEQTLLVEALLTAFNVYALKPFLERYTVLGVEEQITEALERDAFTLHRMSRPDAVVVDKRTGELSVISWKTIDNPTEARRKEFRKDLQGFTESWYTQQWLKGKKRMIRKELLRILGEGDDEMTPEAIKVMGQKIIAMADQPAQVDTVQTIFLVKGPRVRLDKQTGDEEGENDNYEWVNTLSEQEAYNGAWRQDSFLLYPWVFQAGASGGIAANRRASSREELGAVNPLAWKYKYKRPGNKTNSNIGKDYIRRAIGLDCDMSLTDWIGKLGRGEVFPSTYDKSLPNPLDGVIVWETPRYLDQDLMPRIIHQTEVSELARVEWALYVWDVLENHGEDEARKVLDECFPQQVKSCDSPWKCEFSDPDGPCYSAQPLSMTELPEGFERRVPHHALELNALIQIQTKEA